MKFFMIWFSLLFSTITHATLFYPRPFPSTVQDAPVIVRGKVGMSYPDWGKDEGGTKRIYTYTEVQVSEVLKGQSENRSIVIREMGGEKDGVGLHIAGTAQFARGEDVVVFLRSKNAENVYDVHGMIMGKYEVRTDSEGRETLSGPGLMDPNEPTPQKTWSLEELRNLVRSQSLPSPTHTSTPSPQITQSISAESIQPKTVQASAPQLQPAINEVPTDTSSPWFYFGVVTVGLIGALGAFWKSRSQK